MAQLDRLRPALGQALVTDGVDLDRMLALGRSLQNLEADGVTFAAVPTSADPPGPVPLRDVDASTLFAAVRADRPLPAGAGRTARPAPAQLRVGVLNGTERTGLGATVAGSLGTLGFGVGEVGTAEQVTQQTLIRFSPDQAAAAALLATHRAVGHLGARPRHLRGAAAGARHLLRRRAAPAGGPAADPARRGRAGPGHRLRLIWSGRVHPRFTRRPGR